MGKKGINAAVNTALGLEKTQSSPVDRVSPPVDSSEEFGFVRIVRGCEGGSPVTRLETVTSSVGR